MKPARVIPEGCGEGSQGCAVFRATPGRHNTRHSRPGRGAGIRGPLTRSMGATPAFGRTARRFPAPLPRCEFHISLPDPGVRGVPRPLATFPASLQDAPARRPLALRFHLSPGPRSAWPLTKSGVALRLPPHSRLENPKDGMNAQTLCRPFRARCWEGALTQGGARQQARLPWADIMWPFRPRFQDDLRRY